MKISIITACFNSAATVTDTLDSVSTQASADVEHIIVDGGSSDNTLALVKKHGRRVACVISGPDSGIYDALNKGMRAATGDIIGVLHSDDIYAGDGVLDKVARVFAEKKTDAVYGDLVYTRKDGRLLRYWKAGGYDAGGLKRGWMPPHPAFFARRAVYEKYGFFNTDFKIAADYELMLRFLFKHGISAAYLSEVLVIMRVGGKSNKNLASIIAKSREDYRIIRMHAVGGIRTLLQKNISKLHQFFNNGVRS